MILSASWWRSDLTSLAACICCNKISSCIGNYAVSVNSSGREVTNRRCPGNLATYMSYLTFFMCYKCYHNYHYQYFLTQIDYICVTMARAGTYFGEGLRLRISLLCLQWCSLYRWWLCKRVKRKLLMDKSLRLPLPVTYCESFYETRCSNLVK